MKALELNELKLHIRDLQERRRTQVLALRILEELAKHDLKMSEWHKKYPMVNQK